MKIKLIPALSNNYIFLIYDSEQKIAAVVDPAIAEPVIACLKTLDLELVAIFNTHHHSDHVGGNKELLRLFPNLCIYGGEHDRTRIPGQHRFLQDGDRLEFLDRIIEILYVPGHTHGHIAYYFPPVNDTDSGELFCGDTLFAAGCGRLFEGTPEQMLDSLTRLRSLPDSTRVWCAHEYTLSNLEFALTVDTDNPLLQKRYQEVKQLRHQGTPTIPSKIAIEKQTNPFLRCHLPQIQQISKTQEEVAVFAHIRQLKDNF